MAPPRGCPKWLIARAGRAAASRAAPVMDRKAGGATRSRAPRRAAAGSPADCPVPRARTVPTVHPDVVARAQALDAAVQREAQGVATGADHPALPNDVVRGARPAQLPEGDREGGGR